MATLAQGTPARAFTDAAALRAHYADLQRRMYAPRPRPVPPVPAPIPVASPVAAPADPNDGAVIAASVQAMVDRDYGRPQGVPDIPGPTSTATTVRRILATVARMHGMTVEDLKGPRRTARVVRARQDAMAAVWLNCSKLSLPAIGRIMRRDHTTVLHALRQRGIDKGTPRGRP